MVLMFLENGRPWCYQLDGTNKPKRREKYTNQAISKR